MESGASYRASENAVTVVISLRVRNDREDGYRRWQEDVNAVARGFDGFEGAEVHPPGPGDPDVWNVVYRFADIGRLTAWLNSSERQDLLDEGRSLFEGPAKQEVLTGQAHARDFVTAVVSHEVRPGREQSFVRWQERTQRAQEKSPGFMGFELLKPVPGIQEKWVALVRFDTQEHLDEWLESDSRKKLLEEGGDHFSNFEVHKIRSAFSGWFRSGEGTAAEIPPNWKQAMSVLLALYPTVMVLNLTVGKEFQRAGIVGYVALFISNALSVSILTWLLMPMVNKVLAFWLLPERARSVATHVAGAAAIVVCYVLLIGIFGLITS